MRAALRLAAAALLGTALGCASQRGPVYPDFAEAAPPIAPAQARLVVYRTLYTEPLAFYAQISVDGAAVGTLPGGTWLWIDEVAGLHRIDSPVWPAYASFGNQLRTNPLEIELPPGTTSFVAVNLISPGPIEVGLQPVPPEQAQRDLATLEMAPPADALE